MKISNLPGTNGLERPCVGADSITEAIRLMKSGNVVCEAGDTGCVTVYRDDSGIYHGQFYRNRRKLSDCEYSNAEKFKAWLKQWWNEKDS